MGNQRFLSTRRVNASLWVELKNPPVNFLTTAMLAELYEVVLQVARDDAIRVLILTGGIEDVYIMHFSIPELLALHEDNKKLFFDRIVKNRYLGALFTLTTTFQNWLMDWIPGYEALVLTLARRLAGYSTSLILWLTMHRLYLAIERLPKITIAAVNGNCNGGGTELSACFDFRFMVGDQGFTIGQPEVLVNIVPGGGSSQRLPRLIGKARALELMLRGNQLTAQEARDIGLITACFDKAEFNARVQAFADLMSKRPLLAVDAVKKCVHRGLETTCRHGLSIEMEQSLRCLDSPETLAAMQAYIRYLDEHIAPLGRPGINTQDLNQAVQETVKNMEEGRLYPFKR
jgi:enoyl-CoA hydratase/carnithine racemase